MKSTHFKKLLFTAFMLVFIVGCGKDNSSGGGSKGGSSSNPITGGNIGNANHEILTYGLRNTPEGTRVLGIFNQAVAWRNNTQEGQVISPGFTRGVLLPNTNSSLTCKQKELWFLDFEYCYGKNTETQQLLAFEGTPQQVCIEGQGTSLKTKSVASTTKPYSNFGCTLGGTAVNYAKANNVELSKILSLNNKNWSLHNAQYINGVYTIVVGALNAAPSLTYVIDTKLHSVYNPVLIYNQQTQKSTSTIIQ